MLTLLLLMLLSNNDRKHWLQCLLFTNYKINCLHFLHIIKYGILHNKHYIRNIF